MAKTKKKYSPEFKLKAVIEILKGEKTVTQIAGELGTHPPLLCVISVADTSKSFHLSAVFKHRKHSGYSQSFICY